MRIDFGKIVTNSLSALVAAVFVGAAAIVWKGATSIDDKITKANKNILKQQAALKATQETIVPGLAKITTKMHELESQLRSMNKILAESEHLREKISFDPDKAFVLDNFRMKKPAAELQRIEQHRITEQIDARQKELIGVTSE